MPLDVPFPRDIYHLWLIQRPPILEIPNQWSHVRFRRVMANQRMACQRGPAYKDSFDAVWGMLSLPTVPTMCALELDAQEYPVAYHQSIASQDHSAASFNILTPCPQELVFIKLARCLSDLATTTPLFCRVHWHCSLHDYSMSPPKLLGISNASPTEAPTSRITPTLCIKLIGAQSSKTICMYSDSSSYSIKAEEPVSHCAWQLYNDSRFWNLDLGIFQQLLTAGI